MPNVNYAIVTGAASGLGRALSLALAKRGWHLAIADLNQQGSEETLAAVKAAGGTGQVEHLDVTDVAQWEALRERLKTTWPKLDLLVNNAGVGVSGEVGALSIADWQWIMNINLWGPIYGCHTMVDWLKQNPAKAHIVNIASAAAIASLPGMAPYNVTKAGLLSFSETLYGELKPHRIGVTAVCPAFFPTNILRDGRYHTAEQKRMADKLMSRSTCTAEHVSDKIMRAIDRNELYVFVPGIAGFAWRMKRLMPVRFLRRIAQQQAQAVAKIEKQS